MLLLLLLSYHVFVLMSEHALLFLASGLSKYMKNVGLKVETLIRQEITSSVTQVGNLINNEMSNIIYTL